MHDRKDMGAAGSWSQNLVLPPLREKEYLRFELTGLSYANKQHMAWYCMQPLALCEVWASNSKWIVSYSIGSDGAWHGGGQVGHVAPRGRGTSARGTYGAAQASQCFYMSSHLVGHITVTGTAADMSHSPR